MDHNASNQHIQEEKEASACKVAFASSLLCCCFALTLSSLWLWEPSKSQTVEFERHISRAKILSKQSIAGIVIAPAKPRNTPRCYVLLFFYRKIPRLLGSVKSKCIVLSRGKKQGSWILTHITTNCTTTYCTVPLFQSLSLVFMSLKICSCKSLFYLYNRSWYRTYR